MKVIIFGATGPIGKGLIEIILKRQPTWQVYAVTRDISKAKLTNDTKNVTLVEGDPNKREDVMQLSADKDIVYSCIGLVKYEAKHWAEQWPVIISNLLAGSSQKPGQKFVFCDNLYAYGPGQDISPRSKTVSPSKKSKPGVRATIRPLLQERMDRDPSSISVVGAADFFGPGITNSFLGDTFTKAIVNGKPRPLILASSKKIHDFCFGTDFSNALYIASIDSRADGKFWIAPHTIHGKTVQDVASDVARIAGSTNSKLMVIPGWVVRLAAPLDTFFKEMIEMLKFWNQDYTVDDSDFCKVFDVKPTPYDQALKEYVQFYRNVLQEEKA